MKKKILNLFLIIGLLLIIGVKSYAGLQEVEGVLEGVEGWREEKLFIDSTLITNKNKIDKLKKLKDLSLKRMGQYDKKSKETTDTGEKKIYNIIKNVYKYLVYKIEYVLTNPNGGGGVLVTSGNIPTPQTNNGKTPFNGKYVKVDSLGNVQIKQNGRRKYFFPKCIYGTTYWNGGTPHKLDKYKSYGFNCMVTLDVGAIPYARRAGMKVMLQTGLDEKKFEEKLKVIKDNNYYNDILFYYSDYEQSNVGAFARHKKKKKLINQYDPNGHPKYYLNGNTNDAIELSNRGLSDITGSYVYERRYSEAENGPAKIVTLERSTQKAPVVMAQLNFGVGGDNGDSNASTAPIGRKFTPIAMASVAVGAKGLGYWRDWDNEGENQRTPIENVGFINDLKVFSRDIDKLMAMGLIQQSHRSFGVKCGQSDSAQIGAGTRKLNGVGYVILSNWNSGAKTMNCTIENLGYAPKSLTDVLKGRNVGRVNGNSFSVQVPAYHRVVVKLNK